jgi:hypothetical protein
MAYGQKQVFVASPQPGTTNTPFPAGPIPAFVPVTVTVIDTYAAAVIAQTAQQLLVYEEIWATLSQINNTIQAITPNYESVPGNLDKATLPLLSWAGAVGHHNIMDAARASNQIKKNNFDQAVSPEKPIPVNTYDQFLEVIKEANIMQATVQAEVKVVEAINTTTVSLQNWILGTDTYNTFSKWYDDAKDRFLKLFLPRSASALESSAKLLAGDPTPPTSA